MPILFWSAHKIRTTNTKYWYYSYIWKKTVELDIFILNSVAHLNISILKFCITCDFICNYRHTLVWVDIVKNSDGNSLSWSYNYALSETVLWCMAYSFCLRCYHSGVQKNEWITGKLTCGRILSKVWLYPRLRSFNSLVMGDSNEI